MRKIISIRIDPNVWKAARERGLNISRICERALISALQKGENLGAVGSWWWTGRDLNPRPPPCEGGIHSRLNYRPDDSLD